MEEEIKKLTIDELAERTDKTHIIKSPFATVLSGLKYGFNNDFTVLESCHYAGITTDTYYRWSRESDEFVEHMETAKSDFFRKLKKSVSGAVDGGNADMALKLLERRKPKLYAPKQALDLTTKGESIVPVPTENNAFAEWLKTQNTQKANEPTI